MGFFNDDGTKPGLRLICKKLNDPYELIPCNMNRPGQRYERGFKCGAFEKDEKAGK